ncbi:peptidylprolyl isomerase [Hyalangium versicolor]|uniref:peptidylprolyl isomerase n=1 Tax=Hyalangium versicolor TaxID=2861190 RepID=UPI001CCD62BE|nr:peptidylprolyl isomerase [Hyalangium versicolor]
MNSVSIPLLSSPLPQDDQSVMRSLPRVEAPSLEDLAVTISPPEAFTPEQVQARFLELARPLATERYRYPSEKVAWGDEVLFDIVGYSEGKLIPFSVRSGEWVRLEPEPVLPGLFEALVGRTPREKVAVDITLPGDYPVESLRGATARFSVQLWGAREVTYPELENPAFLRAFGAATLAEAMKKVVGQMEAEAKQLLLSQVQRQVLATVAERTRVKVPATLVDEEIRRRWTSSEGQVLSQLGFDEARRDESLRGWLQDTQTRAEVELRLRIGLALGAICKRDKLKVTRERVEKLIRDEANASGLPLHEVAAALQAEPQNLVKIDQMALHLTAVDHVMSRAKVQVAA